MQIITPSLSIWVYIVGLLLGSRAIAKVQDMGGGVYFHPFVPFHLNNGQRGKVMVKYGVVSMDRLLLDLHTWDTLYLAGRFQKPTLVLRNDSRFTISNQINLKYAVRAALCLLPKRFTKQDLYMTITGFSYAGTFVLMLISR
jgi:translocator assembly and maintenance protein 41